MRPERMSSASSYIMLPTWYMGSDSPCDAAKSLTSLRYDFLSIPTWPVMIARMCFSRSLRGDHSLGSLLGMRGERVGGVFFWKNWWIGWYSSRLVPY